MLFNKVCVVSNFGSFTTLSDKSFLMITDCIVCLCQTVFSPSCLITMPGHCYLKLLTLLILCHLLYRTLCSLQKWQSFIILKLRKGTSVLNTILLVCVCTRPSLTQTLRCSWYSLLGAHHTGELFTVVIGTTWQSHSAFCLHVVHESTISAMLVSRNSLRVFVQTDKHCASFIGL